MKIFLYWLISLTISLMLSSMASAEIIYFKDGKKKHVGSTWKENGKVKWQTWGITVMFPEEDIERVEKTPYEEYSIGTRPVKKQKIKKEDKPPVKTIGKSELQSKGVRMGDGLVLKGVSKSSQSIRVVVEAN